MPVRAQLADQHRNARHGLGKGRNFGDLRTNVNAHPSHSEVAHGRCLRVQGARCSNGHSKLVLPKAGRNIGVSARRHVRIHAQSHRRAHPQPGGTLRQCPQFRFALYIEQKDAGLQSHGYFVARLPHTREDNLLRCPALCHQNPLQLSARDYVEPGPLLGQQAQDIQICVCLNRIADGVGHVAEGSIKRVKPLGDHRCRVDIEWSSIVFRKFGYGDVLAVEGQARASPEKARLLLAIDKSRRTPRPRNRTPTGHFRFAAAWEAPLFTFMATTVWSSKVSIPAECSATALKRESTTQSADLAAHSPTICSTRPLPNNSPLRLRASRMPSLKNTNISPGFMQKRNYSYAVSSK